LWVLTFLSTKPPPPPPTPPHTHTHARTHTRARTHTHTHTHARTHTQGQEGSLTVQERRSHMALWCIFAAPLILGGDVRNLSATDLAIVMNPDLISINQDKSGIQVRVQHVLYLCACALCFCLFIFRKCAVLCGSST
jgi:hypothetical protein